MSKLVCFRTVPCSTFYGSFSWQLLLSRVACFTKLRTAVFFSFLLLLLLPPCDMIITTLLY